MSMLLADNHEAHYTTLLVTHSTLNVVWYCGPDTALLKPNAGRIHEAV